MSVLLVVCYQGGSVIRWYVVVVVGVCRAVGLSSGWSVMGAIGLSHRDGLFEVLQSVRSVDVGTCLTTRAQEV